MADRGTRRKASNENRIGMVIILTAVAALIVILLVRCIALQRKIDTFAASNLQLESEIEEQLQRAEEIENLPEYIQSDEYIEKTAREKFGLVYPDEIIFQAED